MQKLLLFPASSFLRDKSSDAAELSEFMEITVRAFPDVSPFSAPEFEGNMTTPRREVEGRVATSSCARRFRKGMVPVFQAMAPTELDRSTTSTTSVREHCGGGEGGGGEGEGGGGEGGGELALA